MENGLSVKDSLSTRGNVAHSSANHTSVLAQIQHAEYPHVSGEKTINFDVFITDARE